MPELWPRLVRRRMRALAGKAADEPLTPEDWLGIGLDFGPAFVRNIGKRWLYDFTAIGDVVNTAFRLQSEAGGGEILLSGPLAEGLDGVAGERVEVPAKGKASPVVAYRTGW
jgi:adenylate cyclase